MDSLDIDKKRAIDLGIRYVDIHWKSVDETEIEVTVLRYNTTHTSTDFMFS